MPTDEEIAMADPDDRTQPEGTPPDGWPRRQPPIIEGEAVEIPVDGAGGSTPGERPSRARQLLTRMLTFLPSRMVAYAAAAGIVAVIIGGAAWIYLAPDGGGGAALQNTAGSAPAPAGHVAGRAAGAAGVETAAHTPASAGRIADTVTETRDLGNRLAAMDAALAAMSERLAALDRTVRDSAAADRAATERADKAAHLLDEARKSGDEQDAAQQLDRGALDDLASRIKTLESRQMTVRQIQERLDRLASAAGSSDKAVRLAVAAAALRNAVERDRPFATELAAARMIGIDEGALAALEPFAAMGLPRRNELFRDLSALLPELRRVSAPPGQELGYLDRLQASAVRMLNIRPAKDEPGDDPPVVLSRIELKMVQQDIDAIIAELDKLPSRAKEIAQPWRTRAMARRDAAEAARRMAITSLAKLGEPVTSGSSPQ
jgi:hypothetical protein